MGRTNSPDPGIFDPPDSPTLFFPKPLTLGQLLQHLLAAETFQFRNPCLVPS